MPKPSREPRRLNIRLSRSGSEALADSVELTGTDQCYVTNEALRRYHRFLVDQRGDGSPAGETGETNTSRVPPAGERVDE